MGILPMKHGQDGHATTKELILLEPLSFLRGLLCKPWRSLYVKIINRNLMAVPKYHLQLSPPHPVEFAQGRL